MGSWARLHEDAQCTVGIVDNVLIVHFLPGPTSTQCLSSWQDGVDRIVKTKKKVLYFGIIETASTPPDAAVREGYTRFFEKNNDNLLGLVITQFGEGFRSAAVRTVISGILNMSPRFRLGFPRHVVGTLQEANSHVMALVPELDAKVILEIVADLRKSKGLV